MSNDLVWVRRPRKNLEEWMHWEPNKTPEQTRAYMEALDREPSILLPEATVRAWREGFGEFIPHDSNSKAMFEAVDAALPAVPPEPWAAGDAVTTHENSSSTTGEVIWAAPQGLVILWSHQPVPMSYSLGNGNIEGFRRPEALNQPVPLPEETS